MSNYSKIETAVNTIRSKQGMPNSIDPIFHANVLREVALSSGEPAGSVDIRKYGAKIDGETSDDNALEKALAENDSVLIPRGDGDKCCLLTKSHILKGKTVYIEGCINYEGTGFCLFWLQGSARVEGGTSFSNITGHTHIRVTKSMARTRSNAVILIHKTGGGVGCQENRVHNVVMDGYGIKSSGIYTGTVSKDQHAILGDDEAISKSVYGNGTGIWLLAGTDVGVSQTDTLSEIMHYNYMEYVYRNAITNVRINGFGDGILLECGWLYLHEDPKDPTSKMIPALQSANPDYPTKKAQPNGWVNGNLFDGIWIRNCRRYIHLKSPLGAKHPIDLKGTLSKKTSLAGECSGNHFNAIDIQTSTGVYDTGILINGGRYNQFNVMHWDASDEEYPLVKILRGFGVTGPDGVIKMPVYNSYGNVINLTGADISLANGGIVDQFPGHNTINVATDMLDKNLFPLVSRNDSINDKVSVLGVVENLLGNMVNVDSLVATYISKDGTRTTTKGMYANPFSNAFNNNPSSRCQVSLGGEGRESIEFDIKLNHTYSLDLVGITNQYSPLIFGGVDVVLFIDDTQLLTKDKNDKVIPLVYKTTVDNCPTGYVDVLSKKANRIKITVHTIDGYEGPGRTLDINSIFAMASNVYPDGPTSKSKPANNCNYFPNIADDNVFTGDNIFDGAVKIRSEGKLYELTIVNGELKAVESK